MTKAATKAEKIRKLESAQRAFYKAFEFVRQAGSYRELVSLMDKTETAIAWEINELRGDEKW